MRLRTLARVAPGAWLVPIMSALIGVYVMTSVTFGPREPYALALTSRSMNALGLIVPVFAGAAAWEGGRLVRGGVWKLPTARHRVVVAGWSTLPAMVGGSAVVVLASLAVLAPQGLFIPDFAVLAAAVSILVGQVALGFALGTLMPRGLAIPVVVLASFLTFVLPRVAGSGWLRQMSGTSLELCCYTNESLDPRVVLTILVGALALVLAAAVLVSSARAGRIFPMVIVTFLAGASVVASITAPTFVRPAVARADTADRCETERGVTVCVWPEHQAALASLADVAADAVATWRDAGVDVPTTYREGSARWLTSSSDAQIYLRTGGDQPSRDKLLASIAKAIADPFGIERAQPACAKTEPWPSAIAGPYVWQWLVTVAGIDELDLYFGDGVAPDSDYFPDAPRRLVVPVEPLVDRVLALPPGRQARWVNRNLRALRECGQLPPLDPG